MKSCLLGVSVFRDKIANNLEENPHLSTLCFTSRFDGVPRDVKVTSYYINKFLPSLTMSFSKEYRDILYDAFQIYCKYSDELLDDVYFRGLAVDFERGLIPLVVHLGFEKCSNFLFEDFYGNREAALRRFEFSLFWLFDQDATRNVFDYIRLSELREIHFQNINTDFDVVYEMMEILKNNEKYNQKSTDDQ